MKITRIQKDIPMRIQTQVMEVLRRHHISTVEEFTRQNLNSLKGENGLTHIDIYDLKKVQDKYRYHVNI